MFGNYEKPPAKKVKMKQQLLSFSYKPTGTATAVLGRFKALGPCWLASCMVTSAYNQSVWVSSYGLRVVGTWISNYWRWLHWKPECFSVLLKFVVWSNLTCICSSLVEHTVVTSHWHQCTIIVQVKLALQGNTFCNIICFVSCMLQAVLWPPLTLCWGSSL
jgi:hypothetical protein